MFTSVVLSAKSLLTATMIALLPSNRDAQRDARVGCRAIVGGDQQLLLTRAKWLAADNSASTIRQNAGIPSYPRDSVHLVQSDSLCSSINSVVLDFLASAGTPHFGSWDGVALAQIGQGVYLADPAEGDGSLRWYFVVRPQTGAVYKFSTRW